MADLAKPLGLKRRGGSWVYRRRVPSELIEVAGRRELKRSFGPVSYDVAKRECHRTAAEFDTLFEQLRKRIDGATSIGRSAPLSLAEVESRLARHAKERIGQFGASKARRMIRATQSGGSIGYTNVPHQLTNFATPSMATRGNGYTPYSER